MPYDLFDPANLRVDYNPRVREEDDPTMRAPILAEYGLAEPFIIEDHAALEKYALETMPVRLVSLAHVGYGIEVGPLLFDFDDVEVLRQAIAGYDQMRAKAFYYTGDGDDDG